MSRFNWLRTAARGVLWAVVYNLLWVAAWFAFKRKEWLDAVAASSPLPLTPEVWFLRAALTLPIGAPILAYPETHLRATPKAGYATMDLWLRMTVGGAGRARKRGLARVEM